MVNWPATANTVNRSRSPNDSGPPSWYGTLAQEHRDGSGALYKRNRYYDPGTQRFTQEDPIGLAGGVNMQVPRGVTKEMLETYAEKVARPILEGASKKSTEAAKAIQELRLRVIEEALKLLK